MKRTTIILVDDHSILRAGVKLMVEQHSDIEVIGEAASVDAAVQLSGSLQPQLVVLDLVIPGGGSEGIDKIRRAFPEARLVILSMHDDPSIIEESMSRGAHGYVTKASAASELVLAIRAVAAGSSFRPSVVGSSGEPGLEAPSPLSPREVDVLGRVAAGYTHKEVAAQLDISVKTVETYRARIAEKTGLKSRVEVLRYAIRHGLLRAKL